MPKKSRKLTLFQDFFVTRSYAVGLAMGLCVSLLGFMGYLYVYNTSSKLQPPTNSYETSVKCQSMMSDNICYCDVLNSDPGKMSACFKALGDVEQKCEGAFFTWKDGAFRDLWKQAYIDAKIGDQFDFSCDSDIDWQ